MFLWQNFSRILKREPFSRIILTHSRKDSPKVLQSQGILKEFSQCRKSHSAENSFVFGLERIFPRKIEANPLVN